MNDKERKAWKACLTLWWYIANHVNTKKKDVSAISKNNLLRVLGFNQDYYNGCPFCELYLKYTSYLNNAHCIGCPIQIDKGAPFGCERDTPYYQWWETGEKQYATAFYKYLERLARRQGYL